MIPFSISIRHEDTKTRSQKFPPRGFLLSRRRLLQSRTTASSESQPLPIVAAGLYLLAPVAMVEVPPRRLRETIFERVARQPSELPADPGRVDRVAAIVSG